MRERRILRLIIVLSIAMAVLLPAYNLLFLNPTITKLLASELETEALRISVHLSRERLEPFGLDSEEIHSGDFEDDLKSMRGEFELYHINVYKVTGDILTPGGQPPAILKSWRRTPLELMSMKAPKVTSGTYLDDKGKKYLTEITVPVIKNGAFQGAFQFFFDMTAFRSRANVLIWASSGVLLIIAAGFLVLVLNMSQRAGQAFRETERARQALELSERKFYHAFNDSPDWMLLSRLSDGAIVDANSSFVKAKGLDYHQVLGKTAIELGIWKSEQQRQEVLKYLENRGSVRNVELYPYMSAGTEPAMLLSADIINVKEEQFVLKVLRDVTDLRRAEQNELDLLRELRIIFDNIPVGIAYLNNEMRFISANRFFMDFVGIEERELVGKQCHEVILQRVEKDGENLLAFEQNGCLCGLGTIDESFSLNEPVVVERKMGEVFTRLTLVPELAPDGKMLRLVFLLEDISEQKRAEDDILGALNEKDVLLKEIHHRVKNNLQIISSLLSLQSRTVGDESLLATFRESQSRIKSMALIHESLYQSDDLSKIDAAQYLRRLGSFLFQTYGTDPEKIRLHLDAGGVRLPVDLAVPCGLIVNELLTNSLKYAFPGGAGEILVSISHSADAYRLLVKDNGVGYSDMGAVRNTGSLGMRLVETLADQLDGTVEMKSNGGAEITVRFQPPGTKGG